MTDRAPDLLRDGGGPTAMAHVVSQDLVQDVRHLDAFGPSPFLVPLGVAGLVGEVRRLVEEGRVETARRMLLKVPEAPFEGRALKHWRRVLAPPVLEVVDATDKDRSVEFAWLRDRADEYSGKWVAVLDNRLVSEGAALGDVLDAVDCLQLHAAPLLHRFP